MTEKRKMWGTPLLITGIVAVLYLLLYQKNGVMPSGTSFDLLNDFERSKNPEAFGWFITLPFQFSRWIDILVTWIMSTYIIRMMLFGFKDLGKEDNKTKKESGFLSTGLCGGIFIGIILGAISSLISWDSGFLLMGLSVILLIGLLINLVATSIDGGFGLGLSLTYGITANMVFGILNLSDMSIFISLLSGLTISIINVSINLIISLLRNYLSRNKQKKFTS